ncbi:MAG: fatty acyl-AMP ligase [Spirochaetota bacterium]
MNKLNVENIATLLEDRSVEHPDTIAYKFIGYNSNDEIIENNITYFNLDRAARRIASVLDSYKSFGTRALLIFPPGIDYITSFFACLYSGTIAVPVYPPFTTKYYTQFLSILSNSKPKFILSNTEITKNIKPIIEKHSNFRNLIWVNPKRIFSKIENYDFNIKINLIAFIQYTSGSTSNPRGVMLSHENLMHNLFLIHRYFCHNSNSCGVIWLPPYHDMGLIGGILQPLYGGFPVILMSPFDFLKKPFRWLQAITKFKATTTGGPNFSYELCLQKISENQLKDLDLTSWDLAFNGAEPIKPSTIENFTKKFGICGFNPKAFYPCYGLAESTLIVTGGIKNTLPTIIHVKKKELLENKVVLASDDFPGQTLTQNCISCGAPLDDNEVLIVNPESGEKCESDRIGEIWVKSRSVALGYFDDSSSTNQTFNAYLSDTGEGPFLRTGDLGFLYENQLYVTGRIKDMIIINGKNIYPHDLERTAENSHPSLRKGCNAAFAIIIDTQPKLVLVQEIIDGEDSNIKEMYSSIRKCIATNHDLYIDKIVLIEARTIPKTSSGKIKRHACLNDFLSNKLKVFAISE